jgi:sarcosine oxidase subunit gamma
VSEVSLATCRADIVEIAAFRGRASELQSVAASHGVTLPARGEARFVAADTLALSVRPERWLLLSPAAAPGESARVGQRIFAGVGAVIEHSSGLAAFYLAGQAWREVLKRGCRLDLDPRVFPPGAAAATIIAQVSVTLAALTRGPLLLTPATTARHFREWLTATAAPFGFAPRPDVTVGPELLAGETAT